MSGWDMKRLKQETSDNTETSTTNLSSAVNDNQLSWLKWLTHKYCTEWLAIFGSELLSQMLPGLCSWHMYTLSKIGVQQHTLSVEFCSVLLWLPFSPLSQSLLSSWRWRRGISLKWFTLWRTKSSWHWKLNLLDYRAWNRCMSSNSLRTVLNETPRKPGIGRLSIKVTTRIAKT
jgi:hypothetical protein